MLPRGWPSQGPRAPSALMLAPPNAPAARSDRRKISAAKHRNRECRSEEYRQHQNESAARSSWYPNGSSWRSKSLWPTGPLRKGSAGRSSEDVSRRAENVKHCVKPQTNQIASGLPKVLPRTQPRSPPGLLFGDSHPSAREGRAVGGGSQPSVGIPIKEATNVLPPAPVAAGVLFWTAAFKT